MNSLFEAQFVGQKHQSEDTIHKLNLSVLDTD